MIASILLPYDLLRVITVLSLLGPKLAVSLEPRKLGKHGPSIGDMARAVQPLLLALLSIPSITANSLGAAWPEISLVLVGSGADSVGANLVSLPWAEDVRTRLETHITATLTAGKPQTDEQKSLGAIASSQQRASPLTVFTGGISMSFFFKRLSGQLDRNITVVGTGPMADAIEAFATDAQGTLEGEGANVPQLPYVFEMDELSGSMDKCTIAACQHASKTEQWKSANEVQKLTLAAKRAGHEGLGERRPQEASLQQAVAETQGPGRSCRRAVCSGIHRRLKCSWRQPCCLNHCFGRCSSWAPHA